METGAFFKFFFINSNRFQQGFKNLFDVSLMN